MLLDTCTTCYSLCKCHLHHEVEPVSPDGQEGERVLLLRPILNRIRWMFNTHPIIYNACFFCLAELLAVQCGGLARQLRPVQVRPGPLLPHERSLIRPPRPLHLHSAHSAVSNTRWARRTTAVFCWCVQQACLWVCLGLPLCVRAGGGIVAGGERCEGGGACLCA
jgi:hypothetical protein